MYISLPYNMQLILPFGSFTCQSSPFMTINMPCCILLLGYSELLFTVQTTVELLLNYPISKKCHIYQVKKSSEAISSCLHECKTSAHTYNWYGLCLRSWVILSLQSLFSLPEGRQDWWPQIRRLIPSSSIRLRQNCVRSWPCLCRSQTLTSFIRAFSNSQD